MEELVYATLIADLIAKVLLVVAITLAIVWVIKTMRCDKRYEKARRQELENIRTDALRIKNLADTCEKAKDNELI